MGKQHIIKSLRNSIFYLHRTSQLTISEIDDKVYQATENSEKIGIETLLKLKVELWISYIEKFREELLKFTEELANKFGNVNKTFSLLEKADKELNSIKSSLFNIEDFISKCNDLYEKLVDEWNFLVEKERDIVNEGLFKFLKVASPWVAIISVAYWYAITLFKDELKFTFGIGIFWYVVTIVVTYYLLKKITKSKMVK